MIFISLSKRCILIWMSTVVIEGKSNLCQLKSINIWFLSITPTLFFTSLLPFFTSPYFSFLLIHIHFLSFLNENLQLPTLLFFLQFSYHSSPFSFFPTYFIYFFSSFNSLAILFPFFSPSISPTDSIFNCYWLLDAISFVLQLFIWNFIN